MKQENCWIGCTPHSGPLIFDPHLQDGMSGARVRFWDVWQKKVVVFDKQQIKRELASLRLQVHSYEDEERLVWELRTAIAEYKRWLAGRKVTRCYRCKLYLDALSEEPCSECGWLRCRCGACGCSYFRRR